MSDDEIQFTCEECGKSFDPDPDTMLETHWEAKHVSIFEDSGIEGVSEEDLKEAGITEEMKERMLNGEDVVAGAMCICRECQDRLLAEQEDDDE